MAKQLSYINSNNIIIIIEFRKLLDSVIFMASEGTKKTYILCPTEYKWLRFCRETNDLHNFLMKKVKSKRICSWKISQLTNL